MRITLRVLLLTVVAVGFAVVFRPAPGRSEQGLEPCGAVVVSAIEADGTALVKWSSTAAVEVRVNTPTGDLFASSPAVEWRTGTWVKPGARFYLLSAATHETLDVDVAR